MGHCRRRIASAHAVHAVAHALQLPRKLQQATWMALCWWTRPASRSRAASRGQRAACSASPPTRTAWDCGGRRPRRDRADEAVNNRTNKTRGACTCRFTRRRASHEHGPPATCTQHSSAQGSAATASTGRCSPPRSAFHVCRGRLLLGGAALVEVELLHVQRVGRAVRVAATKHTRARGLAHRSACTHTIHTHAHTANRTRKGTLLTG